MSRAPCSCVLLVQLLACWLVTGSPVDRLPVVHKRSEDGSSCEASKVPALSTTPLYDFTEAKDELQALWIKRDVLLLVATDTTSTTLYIGTSSSATHLYSLHSDTSSITGPVHTSSLKITVGLSAVILVSADKKTLYVSRDNAVSWSHYALPVNSFEPSRDLTLSHTHSSTIMIHSRTGHLYLSRDYGASWNHIDSNVLQATLVPGAREYLFYSKISNNKVFNPLHRVDLESLQSHLIDSHSYLYVADNRYLFVSRQNYTGNDQTSKQTRRFYVSTNFDKSQPAFSEVQLPAARWEDYVAVMGTHETGAFIHISDRHDMEKGNLYVSGVSGSQFTVSLKNHLLKRVILKIPFSGNRLITLDDFYEVLSMRGVYMSTQVDDDDGGKHYSVITFDNGGQWQRLSLPSSETHCINCSLHVHISYSKLAAADSGGSGFHTGPLSSSNAPGIIIAHGSVGVSREYNASNAQIVVSEDGGMTWKFPNIPKGQYVYGIADYGNIISVVPDTPHTQFLWFSHDRGSCFIKVEFGFSKLFQLSRGLLMDPNTTSLYGFVLGTTGTSSDNNKWTAITLNFGSLLSYPCHNDDYTTIEQPQCVLGYKHLYQITKAQSICYNEHKLSVTINKCNCTNRDYECGYGFISHWSDDGAISCTKDPQFSLAKVCPPGATSYLQSNTGLQLIAGDQCVPTDDSNKKLAKTTHQCTGHESDSGISVDMGSATGRIIGGLILLLVVVISCALGLYCWLRCRAARPTLTTRDRVIYKKIPLNADTSEHSSTDEDILN